MSTIKSPTNRMKIKKLLGNQNLLFSIERGSLSVLPVEKYLADERARGEYMVAYDYQKRIQQDVLNEFKQNKGNTKQM